MWTRRRQSPPPSTAIYPPPASPATASLSQDATAIAWKDGDGLKVAGAPTTIDDPCVLSSAPVLISATGQFPSIGGADVAAFLPKPPPAQSSPPPSGTPGSPGSPGTPGTTSAAPVVALPRKVTARALASARGIKVRVKVAGAGRITVTGTVPARRLRRRGKPIVVVRGSGTASAAGTVTIRLRLTPAARKQARRLKGARLKLRIVHGSRGVTKTIVLR